jgi:hypothetical protein
MKDAAQAIDIRCSSIARMRCCTHSIAAATAMHPSAIAAIGSSHDCAPPRSTRSM